MIEPARVPVPDACPGAEPGEPARFRLLRATALGCALSAPAWVLAGFWWASRAAGWW